MNDDAGWRFGSRGTLPYSFARDFSVVPVENY